MVTHLTHNSLGQFSKQELEAQLSFWQTRLKQVEADLLQAKEAGNSQAEQEILEHINILDQNLELIELHLDAW